MKEIHYNSDSIDTISPIVQKRLYDIFDDYLSNAEEYTIVNDDISLGKNLIKGATYSYFIKDNKYYYTSMVDCIHRKACYDAYDSIIGNKFQCTILDKYSYSINYYPYTSKLSAISIYQILEQLYKFNTLNIPILPNSTENIINEYSKISNYINKPYLIKDIEDNIDELYKYYGVAQGSAGVNRLLTDGNIVFYDYIALYTIKPTYTSLYRDLAQFYISIIDNGFFVSLFNKWCLSKNINIDLILILKEFEEEYFINDKRVN